MWTNNLDEDNENLEEEVNELVLNVELRDNMKDKGSWSKGVYSIKEAYSSILDGFHNCEGVDKTLAAIWSKIIPLKSSVLV